MLSSLGFHSGIENTHQPRSKSRSHRSRPTVRTRSVAKVDDEFAFSAGIRDDADAPP